jgi:hypothetical protein
MKTKKHSLFGKWAALVVVICLCEAAFAQTHITDRAGLAAISGSGSYILDADIDLADGNWTPITSFSGTLDGNGHIIKNMTIAPQNAMGLFETLKENAVVKNLGFENAYVVTTGDYARTAALAAFLEGDAVIENCYIANSTIGGRWCVGSFVGRARNLTDNGTAAIRNCYSSAYLYNPAINNNSGHTGGIIGNIFDGNAITVENCYFSGIIQKEPNTQTPTEGQVCGIVGWIGNDANPQTLTGYTIRNNVNLAPYLLSPNGKHRISSTRGDVAGNDPVPGPNYSISTTSLGDYNSWGNTSSIVATGTVDNKDGANLPGGDSDAKAQSFYETLGWDFTAGTGIWTIDAGASYPCFAWTKDTSSFVIVPDLATRIINVAESSPADLKKYFFSGRGKTLTFSGSHLKIIISNAGIVNLAPPVPVAETIDVDVTVTEGAYSTVKTLRFALTPTASTNADLSDITLSAGQLVPAFDPNETNYTVSVPAGVTSITATAAKDDATASVAGDGAIDVTTATATQTITVTAAATNQKVYTISYIIIDEGEADVTPLAVNSSFEYAYAGYRLSDHTHIGDNGKPALSEGETAPTGWTGDAWRASASTYQKFYGWETSISPVTVDNFGTNSQGLNRDMEPVDKIDGMYALWFGGNLTFPEVFELYQVIDKDNLPAGTYKVQARLAVGNNKRTSQRLFANQNVQYHGEESQYENNLTSGESATFAGWGDGEKNLQEMTVYTTIADADSLKFGIRTSSKLGDGTTPATANPPYGWFKADYFRITKIADAVAADATLASLTLSVGSLDFDPAITVYEVTLPEGTLAVTPVATPSQPEAKLAGTEEVNLESGSGTSVIVVTALNGATNTYTVNYTVDNPTALPASDRNDPVVSQRYYTLLGVAVKEPVATGVYIVRQTLQSGSERTVKTYK